MAAPLSALDKLHLVEPVGLGELGRLANLLIGEVDANHAAAFAGLEGCVKAVSAGSRARSNTASPRSTRARSKVGARRRRTEARAPSGTSSNSAGV